MDHDSSLSVTELCEIAGVSRSGYYNWVKSAAARDEKEAKENKPKVIMLDEHNHILSDIGREKEKQTVKSALKKAEKKGKKKK